MDHGSNNFAKDNYQYDPGAAWGPSDYDATHVFKLWGVWSPTVFQESTPWIQKLAGG